MVNTPENHKLNDALEQEIKAALGNDSVEDLYDLQAGTPKGSRATKKGVVVAIHGKNVLVEFGPRAQGYCPKSHFETLPQVGESLEFVIERKDQDEMYVLSRKGAIQKASWDALEIGHVVESRCTGTNKGGLEMELSGHKAFMPAGQVAIHHIPDLTVMTGEKMACEVIELDKRANRIVLSRRKVLLVEQEEARREQLETLEVGNTYDATITSVQPYGAFADIGGLEGLIHKSEMTWERSIDPTKFVKLGDVVRIQVLEINVDGEKPKLAFGMKQLIEDPFVSSMAAVAVGETITGPVTRLADFGAFVDIGNGAEGLIHISELAEHRIKSPKDVVSEGQEVTVKILSVDAATKRVGLSLKQANQSDEQAPAREDDASMRKLRAKFGNGPLKGGIG